jgi:hypothetical protein
MKRAFTLTLLISFSPGYAYAYVDPGFLGSLYQIVYMLIFGVLAGWVLRPYKYLVAMFEKLKARIKNDNPG